MGESVHFPLIFGIYFSWTIALQVPLSMGFSRQEYWSGLPFPSPGDHPKPGIEPGSPALQADSLPTELQGKLPFFIGKHKKKQTKKCMFSRILY